MSDRRPPKESNKKPSSPPRRRRPDPVPPAPNSLVTLIRKNKSVLRYFTSLQDNLNADVQKWKDNSNHYQALYEEQLAENEALKRRLQSSSRKRKRGESEGEEDDSQEGKQKSSEVPKKRPPEQQANDSPPAAINLQKRGERHAEAKISEVEPEIDDSMFDVSSSSDEDAVSLEVEKADEPARVKNDHLKKKKSSSAKESSPSYMKRTAAKSHSMFDFGDSSDDEKKGDDNDCQKPAAKQTPIEKKQSTKQRGVNRFRKKATPDSTQIDNQSDTENSRPEFGRKSRTSSCQSCWKHIAVCSILELTW